MGTNKNNLNTAKIIIDNFLAKTKSLQESRKANFDLFNNFAFLGNQWLRDEEPDDDRPAISFNQSQELIEAYQAKLFPRDPVTGILSVGVKISGITDKNKRAECESKILASYDENKFFQILLEQSQNFFYGGSACLYYPRIAGTTKAKIISLDPSKCFLSWSGNELEQFAFEDDVSISDISPNDQKQSWIIKAIDYILGRNTTEINKFEKVKRYTYWDKNVQIIKVGDFYQVFKNSDGFIPFSWIPNNPRSHSHEGISEVAKLYELEKQYNQRASDYADRVKINTDAVLALMSDRDMKDIKRDDVEKLIKLGKGDDAKFLNLPENSDLLKFLDKIEKRLASKMSLNDAVMGNIKSNVSSLSMIYYFSPLLDKISLKRVYWDQAFKDLNSAILFYVYGKHNIVTSPVYNPVIISDRETQINNTIRLLDNHLISYSDAIDELRGSENSTEKFEEIKEEWTELSKIPGFLTTDKKIQYNKEVNNDS